MWWVASATKGVKKKKKRDEMREGGSTVKTIIDGIASVGLGDAVAVLQAEELLGGRGADRGDALGWPPLAVDQVGTGFRRLVHDQRILRAREG